MSALSAKLNNVAHDLLTSCSGINDYSASAKDGDHMLEAAEALLGQVQLLTQAPTNAKSFLVIDDYGRGRSLRIFSPSE